MASSETVNTIIDREKEAQKYMRENYYDELTEVFRAIKVRTKPIYKRDENGKNTTEVDTSRTNVAMPDLNLIFRRNTARYTAQPYRLNYIGGNPLKAMMLSALAIQQYSRSDESIHDRRVVMMAEGIGFSYSKLWWDHVSRTMNFRKLLMRKGEILNRDRAEVMRFLKASDLDIRQAVSDLGPEMSDDEVSAHCAKYGKEIVVPTPITKYDGPAVKSVFPGDLSIEPGVLALQDSDWIVESYRESALWLKKQLTLTYVDENGEEIPAFDPEAVKELIEQDPEPEKISEREDDLRWMMESAMGRTEVRMEKRLRGRKKFDILEQHEIDDDGRMWITWASKAYREKPLGKMPYPWDFYGHYTYTELVPLPDMISCYGDSTPRLLRFLHLMHNQVVAQNYDYITNLLKKFVLRREGVEIQSDVIDRGLWRELPVNGDLNGLKVLDEPGLPAGSFERVAHIRSEMAAAEPALNTVEGGTSSNPMAGKLATTAVLNAKAADALTQFKMDARSMYLRQLGQKKLWMNMQVADEPWTVESKFWSRDLNAEVQKAFPEGTQVPQDHEWAVSDRNGKCIAIRLDPYEVQEDYMVEPEEGSYLAIDDELRQDAAMKVQQVAAANPGIVDVRKVTRFQLSTIRGIGNPDDYILPEQPQDPNADIKRSLSASMPLDKMPADVVNQVLPMMGLQPSQELTSRDTMHGVKTIAEAARAADEMTQPAGENLEAKPLR